MIPCDHENGGCAYLARLWFFVTLGVSFKGMSARTCLANNGGISSKLFEWQRSASCRELLMHLRSTCTARSCSRGRRYTAPVVGRAHVDNSVQGPSMR
ncbi:hypothetical protein HYDPIDRAFT_120528 [Hydnomerulius pinastri MD-312]|uniref:Secreted protein n=1 Tax=Hydnomerulius pinastri MD-312 TaxID=994086 RepID=A0A0C9UWX5_9AGAM|nr:hypothetical protein HYDPIDRAFT_120528 [Hydnomerulius pinastri MD-312]